MYIDLSTGLILEQVFETKAVIDGDDPQIYCLTIGTRRGGENYFTVGRDLYGKSYQKN